MLHFTPVTAESMPLLRPYYETCPYRLCEYSSGVKYMWRGHLRSEYAFTDGCLVIRNRIDGVPQFDYPIPGPEGDVDAARAILQARIDSAAGDTGYPENAVLWQSNAQVQVQGNCLCLIALPEGYTIPENVLAPG